jgi:protein-tyrosine phosphatase
MIDLHAHILPGIDDGVKTEDEAVEFARAALEDGVRVVVATPHCREGFFVNEREDVLAHVRRLRARLLAEGVPLELKPGAEVHLCPDLVERVRDGRAPTLDDNGRTLLLELSLSQYPVELDNLVFELKLAGIDPVFAHPERVRYFQDDVRRYEQLVRMGAYGQITTGSVLGEFGGTIREFSEELLRKDLVHVLASDAHGVRRRPPQLTPALVAMADLVGERRARAMADEAPAALLAGREPVLPPVDGKAARRGSFLARWWRGRDGGDEHES